MGSMNSKVGGYGAGCRCDPTFPDGMSVQKQVFKR
jgi:hypothetical protein